MPPVPLVSPAPNAGGETEREEGDVTLNLPTSSEEPNGRRRMRGEEEEVGGGGMGRPRLNVGSPGERARKGLLSSEKAEGKRNDGSKSVPLPPLTGLRTRGAVLGAERGSGKKNRVPVAPRGCLPPVEAAPQR